MIVLSCGGRFSASVDELQLSSERTQVWVPHKIRATQRLSGNSDKTDMGTSQASSYPTLVSGVGTSQESVALNFGSSSIALSLTNTEEPVTCRADRLRPTEKVYCCRKADGTWEVEPDVSPPV